MLIFRREPEVGRYIPWPQITYLGRSDENQAANEPKTSTRRLGSTLGPGPDPSASRKYCG